MDASVTEKSRLPEGVSSCTMNLSSLSSSAPLESKPMSRSSGMVIVWAVPVEGVSVITFPAMDIVYVVSLPLLICATSLGRIRNVAGRTAAATADKDNTRPKRAETVPT